MAIKQQQMTNKLVERIGFKKILNIMLIATSLSIGCGGILALLLTLVFYDREVYFWGYTLLVGGGVLFFIVSLLNKIVIQRILVSYLLGVLGTLGLVMACGGLVCSIEALLDNIDGVDGLIIICIFIGIILAFSMWLLFFEVYIKNKDDLDMDKSL